MERTYKKIEIVGISETSFGEATQNAVAKACQSLRHVDWFEVTEMRGVLLVNPGSPTFPRNLTRRLGTVGFLEVQGRTARAWIHQLEAAAR